MSKNQLKEINQDEKKGTLSTAALNMIKTYMGAGIIMIPATFAVYGAFIAPILILFSGFTSWIGLWLYTLIASKLGRKSSPLLAATTTVPFLWFLF